MRQRQQGKCMSFFAIKGVIWQQLVLVFAIKVGYKATSCPWFCDKVGNKATACRCFCDKRGYKAIACLCFCDKR